MIPQAVRSFQAALDQINDLKEAPFAQMKLAGQEGDRSINAYLNIVISDLHRDAEILEAMIDEECEWYKGAVL